LSSWAKRRTCFLPAHKIAGPSLRSGWRLRFVLRIYAMSWS